MKKEFKAESKRLLDLMINSIYTHQEIFIRELISNASDALDKLYYSSLDQNLNLDKQELQIDLRVDKENRVLIISDNGIGMSEAELETNLGTIAKSDSFDFKQDHPEKNQEIIGQFGVGFYSSFMVAQKVEVHTRRFDSETGYLFSSDVVDGYQITEAPKATRGTEIRLFLKANTEEENYDQYLEQYQLESLVKKYSDYIRYPIKMDVVEVEYGEKEEDKKETIVNKTLNSMVPLWKKSKSEITQEEYDNFYTNVFYDFQKPLRTIHTQIEGRINFTALLFIPAKAPYDFYSDKHKKGLDLYTNGVFIKNSIEELVPEHFRFVKGLVDSSDLSLNISREMLQHDRQLTQMATLVEKKIKSELAKCLVEQREEYEKFYQEFGVILKYGAYNEYGRHKEQVQDLLMFYSANQKKLITFQEYVATMKEDQKDIYYASGKSYQAIDTLPKVEKLKSLNYDILYLVDSIDEFALTTLRSYQEKTFKNVASAELDLLSESEKAEIQKASDENKDLLAKVQEILADKVKEVVISSKLVSHPVCLSSKSPISLEMENILKSMPNNQGVAAEKVLELNPNHPLFARLQAISGEPSELQDLVHLLYNQALLVEGYPLENPLEFTNLINKFITK